MSTKAKKVRELAEEIRRMATRIVKLTGDEDDDRDRDRDRDKDEDSGF